MLLNRKELVKRILENTEHGLITDEKELKKVVKTFLKRNTQKYCTAKYKKIVIQNQDLLKDDSLIFYTGSGDNIQLLCLYVTELKEDSKSFNIQVDNAAIEILRENQVKEMYNNFVKDFYTYEHDPEEDLNLSIEDSFYNLNAVLESSEPEEEEIKAIITLLELINKYYNFASIEVKMLSKELTETCLGMLEEGSNNVTIDFSNYLFENQRALSDDDYEEFIIELKEEIEKDPRVIEAEIGAIELTDLCIVFTDAALPEAEETLKTYNFVINISLVDLGIEAESLEAARELIKLKYEDLHDIELKDNEIELLKL